MEHATDVVPDNTALIVNEDSPTYRELEKAANRIAHFFSKEGIDRGAHVGLLSRNTIEHVVVMLAVLKIRATPINLNYRYTAPELAYVAKSGDLDAIFFERGFEATVADAVSGIPSVRVLLVAEDGAPTPSQLEATEYTQALSAGSPRRDFGPRSPDDIHSLHWRDDRLPEGRYVASRGHLARSGRRYRLPVRRTAGRVRSGRACTIRATNDGVAAESAQSRATTWATLMHLFAGHTTILMNKFDPAAAWSTIDRHKVQIFS